jgi:hypothetical protein
MQSLHVPHATGQIFSPAHWAQNMLKLHPHSRPHCILVDRRYWVLSWTISAKHHKITLPVAPHNNILHLYVKVPCKTCSAFTSAAGLNDDDKTVTFPPPAEVTDDEESISSNANHPDEEDFDKDWSIPYTEGADDTTSVDFDKDAPRLDSGMQRLEGNEGKERLL